MSARAKAAPARRATLRDVAALAGTTPMTVSNVINGRAGQVGEVLSQRVLDACRTLGYRPDANARRLRTNRRQAVGLVIVDPSPAYLSDPLTAAMLAGLNARLGRDGYSTVLHGVSPTDLDHVTFLRQIESDGICLLLSGRPRERLAVIRRLAALGQPVILLQDDLPQEVADGASLLLDDQGGAETLAEHLFERPSRHAVMLVPKLEWPAMSRREAGVRSIIRRLASPPEFHVIRCVDEGFTATKDALAGHIARFGLPDVVIGGNDQMGIAGMKLLQERGVRVPQQVRVSGFNGLEFWRYAEPELTTVFSPAYALGEAAGEAMLARLATGMFPTRRKVLPVRLLPHRSTVPALEHENAKTEAASVRALARRM